MLVYTIKLEFSTENLMVYSVEGHFKVNEHDSHKPTKIQRKDKTLKCCPSVSYLYMQRTRSQKTML